MKKYLNPEYVNSVVMSNDVITLSHVSTNKEAYEKGEVNYLENVYKDTATGEYSVQIGADVSTLLGQ